MSTNKDNNNTNEVAIANTFTRTVQDAQQLQQEQDNIIDENRNIYEIKQPLYPIKSLVNYYANYGFDYEKVKEKYPEFFPYDNSWVQWWKDVNQIAKARKIQTQPIIREVPIIYRYKFGNQEKLCWSERYRGVSTKTGQTVTFKHIAGMYFRHNIETRYNEEKDQDENVLRGQQKVYYIDYKPEYLDELYRFAPLNKQQKLQVMVMNRPYGNLGLFKNDEFRNSTIENLAQVALSAKGLVHTDYNANVVQKGTKQFEKQRDEITDVDEETALKVLLSNPNSINKLADIIKDKLGYQQQPAAANQNTSKEKQKDIK